MQLNAGRVGRNVHGVINMLTGGSAIPLNGQGGSAVSHKNSARDREQRGNDNLNDVINLFFSQCHNQKNYQCNQCQYL